MRGAAWALKQVALVAAGVALIGAVIGGLVAQFATSHGFLTGGPYGIICGGLLVAFLSVSSQVQATDGSLGTNLGSLLPPAPAQFLFGGLLAFGAGIALLALGAA